MVINFDEIHFSFVYARRSCVHLIHFDSFFSSFFSLLSVFVADLLEQVIQFGFTLSNTITNSLKFLCLQYVLRTHFMNEFVCRKDQPFRAVRVYGVCGWFLSSI